MVEGVSANPTIAKRWAICMRSTQTVRW